MKPHRIVSFLPAATEMVCALGLGEHLVGVSHECDYPSSVRSKPVVVRPALPIEKMSLAEIDRAVSARLGTGASLYEIDEAALRALRPTLILTQNLCQVCAPSGNEITQVLRTISPAPEIVWLTPRSLAEVNDNLRTVGRATGRSAVAEDLIRSAAERLERMTSRLPPEGRRLRVFCLEWVDPLYCSGHWVGEMVERAGGEDKLSRRGSDSVRIAWDEVREWAPEVLVVMPCGFRLGQAIEQAKHLAQLPGWSDLPAVRDRRVYAVDANSYFARPGPRLADGIELLAHLLYPERVPWTGAASAFAEVRPGAASKGEPWPRRTKRCSRCGAEFCCGPAPGQAKCWCDELPVVGPIGGEASDCLCPACLRAALAGRATISRPG